MKLGGNIKDFRTTKEVKLYEYYNDFKEFPISNAYYYNTLNKIDKGSYIQYILYSGYITRGIRKIDGFKTRQSLNRAFNSIHQLIYLNMNLEKMVFVTLTFKENIIDYDKASRRFKYFITKYREIHTHLKYLAVWEHQEKRGLKNNDIGTIHFHLIIFNYDNSDIWKLWTYGFVNVKVINDFENFESIGNYLGAYLSKQPVSFNRKMYFTSRNLKRFKKERIDLSRVNYIEKNSDFDYSMGNFIKVYLKSKK